MVSVAEDEPNKLLHEVVHTVGSVAEGFQCAQWAAERRLLPQLVEIAEEFPQTERLPVGAQRQALGGKKTRPQLRPPRTTGARSESGFGICGSGGRGEADLLWLTLPAKVLSRPTGPSGPVSFAANSNDTTSFELYCSSFRACAGKRMI